MDNEPVQHANSRVDHSWGDTPPQPMCDSRTEGYQVSPCVCLGKKKRNRVRVVVVQTFGGRAHVGVIGWQIEIQKHIDDT